ncbi:ATP-dependent RNA helicase DDX42-like isoform X2 [Hylaeus volcanicus]|uniref:ATP-dependent RNA helicase DDX42-like isoform X2 n=1 Tax=Hylaeus volcanicus TaxID=313075 RepID=UPI0023B78502|nr:ATP-dependent RNA helicase DDX42-like isoform X2 [Hylaeus volcanicus]
MNLSNNKEKERGFAPQDEEVFEKTYSSKENLFQKRREKAILALSRAKAKSNGSIECQIGCAEALDNSKDPLDQFMEKIENELKEDASKKKETSFSQMISTEERFENDEDTLADITELMEKKIENQRDFIDSDDELEIDENGNLKPKKLQRKLIPLVDHSMRDYKPFQRVGVLFLMSLKDFSELFYRLHKSFLNVQ